MALIYDHIANAPVMGGSDSFTHDGTTYIARDFSAVTSTTKVDGFNQDGTVRPVRSTRTQDTFSWTLEVLNNLQLPPETNTTGSYTKFSGSSGTFLIESRTLTAALNTVSTYAITATALSGSYMT